MHWLSLRSPSPFFLSQRLGRWRWPWLALSVPVAGIVAVLAGGLVLLAIEVMAASGMSWADEAADQFASDTEELATSPALLSVELVFVGAPLWLAAMAASIVHGRSIRSLVAPLHKFRWNIVAKVLMFEAGGLIVLGFGPRVVGLTGGLELSGFSFRHVVWFLPLAALIFLQTSGEDVLFKGYLLRQLGAATAVFWLAPVVITVGFVWLHLGNPDLDETLWLLLPLFVASELVIIYLMLRTAGMEVPLTLHWTNNAVIFLLIAERESQANDLTVFVWDEDPTTLTDDIIGVGILGSLYLVAQLVAFTWGKSPLFLPRSELPQQSPTEPTPTDPAPVEPPPSI